VTTFLVLILAYLAVGLIFLLRSETRGFIADMLFALLWPVYLWLYVRHGL
jgi:hypothetical protein